MLLYGCLYIGYAYRKSMGVENFHLTLTLKGRGQGQRSRFRSLGFVAHQIKANIAWNMMVITKIIFGPTLTNGLKVKL